MGIKEITDERELDRFVAVRGEDTEFIKRFGAACLRAGGKLVVLTDDDGRTVLDMFCRITARNGRDVAVGVYPGRVEFYPDAYSDKHYDADNIDFVLDEISLPYLVKADLHNRRIKVVDRSILVSYMPGSYLRIHGSRTRATVGEPERTYTV